MLLLIDVVRVMCMVYFNIFFVEYVEINKRLLCLNKWRDYRVLRVN